MPSAHARTHKQNVWTPNKNKITSSIKILATLGTKSIQTDIIRELTIAFPNTNKSFKTIRDVLKGNNHFGLNNRFTVSRLYH